MKILLSIILLSLSTLSLADDQKKNNMMMFSMFTNPAGQDMKEMEAFLLKSANDNEERGYNRCGVYKHRRVGSSRSAYMYCYFNDYNQWAKIEDIRDSESGTAGNKQMFSDHTDHLLGMAESNLKPDPKYVLLVRATFGSYLTGNERSQKAKQFHDYYENSFGGCNLMEHLWGPEIGYYTVCGFENYKEFAKAMEIFNQSDILEQKLDLLEHSDEILIRVDN